MSVRRGDNTKAILRLTLIMLVFFAFMFMAVGSTGEAPDITVSQEAQDVSEPVKNYTLLKSGSKGEAVLALQQRLYDLGYDPGGIDGIYGSGTKNAVKEFQRRNGLEDDGLAGKDTQKRLYSEDAIPAPTPDPPVDVLSGEWPALVNRENPIDDGFQPADLVELKALCDSSLVKIKYSDTQGVLTAVNALITMLEAAREDGITNWQISAGYRSYADQEKILENKISYYLNHHIGWSRSRARSAALTTVAVPGESEHHLGLAFDINVPNTSSFAGTKQCKWLHANCWDYGFIIRYQKGKEKITGYTAEAWHIRYVGIEHSQTIRDLNLCLEEYLTMVNSGEIDNEVLD